MAATPALAPTEIEARTTRKVWTRIIPFVLFLFVINYIDRVNIGFAALTTLIRRLRKKANQEARLPST